MPGGLDPYHVAELTFEARNADPAMLGRDRHGIDLAGIATAYRVGETALAVVPRKADVLPLVMWSTHVSETWLGPGPRRRADRGRPDLLARPHQAWLAFRACVRCGGPGPSGP